MNNAIFTTRSANATTGVAVVRERAGLLPMGAFSAYARGAQASAWTAGAGFPASAIAASLPAHRSRSAIPVPLPLTG
ncbi:hypothetical protein [Williamsia sp. CHRR-6]|uniref:hypothetical protein n=1 Tax=Williamsia sp. CHRR-6 TaxID=2835871 RepID=UPI001BDA9874|nr:hypothetical protein [Williamsia sp. CHRR-6]MBT0565631.1 hypothetical protein [Williamsia sp. CHRR-6]